MCISLKPSVEAIPKLSGIEVKRTLTDMNAFIRTSPIRWNKIKLTDSIFYTPSFDDWVKIINYLKKKIPKYRTDKFDCENFAGWFRVMVGDKFGINTMGDVEGWHDFYRHGWNVFPDSDGFFWQLESQTGEIFDIDDSQYKPDEIVMG